MVEIENLNINVNIFEILKDAFEEHFNRRTNKLGCSEIPFCARKTIISRLYKIPITTNMKMLHGKIHHSIIQEPKVLERIISSICEQLHITEPVKVIKEKVISFEILEGKFLEGHIDVDTTYFIIEIKTTSVPLKYWSTSIAPFHYIQSNNYLGIEKKEFGFILHINLHAYQSVIIDLNEVWQKYACFIPITFDQEIFDLTMDKAKTMFLLMEEESFDIAGPEFEWECKTCPKEIQEICKKPKSQIQIITQ